jgi:hypothetical protein
VRNIVGNIPDRTSVEPSPTATIPNSQLSITSPRKSGGFDIAVDNLRVRRVGGKITDQFLIRQIVAKISFLGKYFVQKKYSNK